MFQKLHFPTRLSFLSPNVSPDIYPPGVIKQISVPSSKLILKIPSFVPHPLFI